MPNETIREEISKKNAIPFARFMELALYCPETGYYETEKGKVGRGGDFITSVSTGNLFGEMLAFQFAEWLKNLGLSKNQNEKFKIIEAGAHDGKLAADILHWLKKNQPEIFAAIEYSILEPSPRRQNWQRETLKDFSNARWFSDFENFKTQDAKFTGIIFSNELLDAFPIRRFGWDAKNKKWFEWGVALENEKFIWAKIEKPEMDSPSSLFHLPSSLLEVLPDGYTIENSPSAENWWREAAGILARGKLLAIDYGFTEAEQFSPARTNGTLRAYFRHHVTADVLANPGEQDLTAHVNFSAIQKVGEIAGLTTEFFSSQAKFLTKILAETQGAKNFGEWDSARARQFQTLTHPEHFGRAFRALVQSK